MTVPVRSGRDAGFTLLETLGAIALMGVVLWSLSLISSQWLQSWRKSHDRLQRIEVIAMALDRIAADLGEANFVGMGNGSKPVVFEGHSSAVTFVRTAIGPNTRGGLELVRIGESMAVRDGGVARSSLAFVPGTTFEVDPASSPVLLLRRPFRLSFEFAGADGIWRTDWQGEDKLPWTVRVTVRDGSGLRTVARVAAIHVRLPPLDGCSGRTCADQVSDRLASVNHPDGEPPTLEQVTHGERSE